MRGVVPGGFRSAKGGDYGGWATSICRLPVESVTQRPISTDGGTGVLGVADDAA